MGSHPWYTSTPYKEPLQQALHELRHREFLQEVAADQSQYKSPESIEEGIAEYIEECDADGTCSILDIEQINSTPDDMECGCACPLSAEKLTAIFGKDKPTKAMLEDHSFRSAISNVYELIDRGQAVYIIAHIADKPSELHFYGMSYD